MSSVEDAAQVLAEHQRITSEPGGPCWCGDWPHDEVRRDTWMDHVSTALADAGLLRPDGDIDHAACHEHADVIADQRNAVIRHGRVPAPDDEHTSDGRCKYPMTCATARPDGDTRTETQNGYQWADEAPMIRRAYVDNILPRHLSSAAGDKVFTRTVTTITGPWVEVPS